MKKSSLFFLAVVSVVSCSKSSDPCDPGATPTQNAHLCVDKTAILFNQDIQSGTLIGSSAQESLAIRNVGAQTLTLASVTLSGDGAFTKIGPTKTDLVGNTAMDRVAFVGVYFAPTAYKGYSAKLTIVSNSEVNPTTVIDISGRGCKQNTIDGGIIQGVCPIIDGGM